MKPLGLLSQIFAIGLAIAIVVLFVRPTFAEIGSVQNDIEQYSQERARVTDTNAILAAKVSQVESISVDDRLRLATYLPSALDEIAVLRDLEIIADNAGVTYTTITYVGEQENEETEIDLDTDESKVIPHEFSIIVNGTYERIKDFLSLLEQNHYPLQVHNLQFSTLEGGFLSADAVVVTYITDVDNLTAN